MSVTVHVPIEYEFLNEIKKITGELGLAIDQLKGSKSLKVVGKKKDIRKFMKKMELEHKEVSIFNSRDNKGKIKNYMVPKKEKSENLGQQNNNYTPVQIAEIYGFPKTTKTEERVNIAIIELGGGYKVSDLEEYWRYLGLSIKPNVIPISVDGATNSPGSPADGEVVLDIEVIGGIVPNSNIYVYFAPNNNQGFYDAVHAAIYDTEHNPSVISISWGMPENHWTKSEMIAFSSLIQKATEKGINVCVASGDNGATDGEFHLFFDKYHVDFPASSPYSLACGGTTLLCPNCKYSDNGTSELVWGTTYYFSSEGGGGGYSSVFDKPSYQVLSKKTKRGVPDVCGVADPNTGWIIYLNEQYQVIGGTSAVAPMWAAYLSLLGVKSFITPKLYSCETGFHDIIKGDNHGYHAGKGWDPASGLGSPNGTVLNSML